MFAWRIGCMTRRMPDVSEKTGNAKTNPPCQLKVATDCGDWVVETIKVAFVGVRENVRGGDKDLWWGAFEVSFQRRERLKVSKYVIERPVLCFYESLNQRVQLMSRIWVSSKLVTSREYRFRSKDLWWGALEVSFRRRERLKVSKYVIERSSLVLLPKSKPKSTTYEPYLSV